MASVMFSDLSQMLQLRRDTVRVRQDLNTAALELSSGKKGDLGKAVSGNFGPLVAIDNQLSRLGAFETNSREATLFTDTAQTALERIKNVSGELALELSAIKETDVERLGKVIAVEAESALDLTVAALNSTAGGRSVFAGTATDMAAVVSTEELLSELKLAITGLTSADDVANAISDWFEGGSYETMAYLGGDEKISPFQVAEGRKVGMPITANDPVIREQLAGLAMAALIGDSDISDPGETARLANIAGQRVTSNQVGVLELQAGVGTSQARIEDAKVQNSAETTALQLSRSEIVSVDPYQAASELQNLQGQLETIYTITARLSGLSLTNYLR